MNRSRTPLLLSSDMSSEPVDPSLAMESSNPGPSLQQLLAIVRAHWKTAAVIAAGVIVLGWLVVKLLPKSYTATATIIVNSDVKDPLAGQDFSQQYLGSFVATQIELMLSPIVLNPVVERLKLTTDPEFSAGFGSGDATALLEYVERRLSANLEVEQGRGGHLLYLYATSRNPARAAQIANAVADVYLDQERRRTNDPAGDRASRYSEQLAELRTKATAAQDRVTEFRKKNHITDVTASNQGTEVQALSDLEQRLLEAQNIRRGLEAKQTGKPGTTDEALASDSVQGLRTQISNQEVQLAQLSSTLGPQHPKVIELQSQIAATRRGLAAEMHTLSENVATQIGRARELEAKLEAAIAAQRTKVMQLRELQDEGTKLTLELESAQSVYKRALDGYDQILFASVGNYSNVRLISAALPPQRASKPNKLKLFLLVIVAAIGLSLGGPVVYEFLFNRRVRCVDDIERGFGIPVLALLDAKLLPAAQVAT